jgi:hypothetical protein
MKIVLSVVDDRRWQGLVEIEDAIYKVTLWPGSATEEWKALLQTAAWVELDEGKIPNAITKAKERYDLGGSALDSIQELLEMARGNADLERRIREVMSSGGPKDDVDNGG